MRDPQDAGKVNKAYMTKIPLKYYKKVEVQPGELGILYYDNQVVKELQTGTYYYWVYAKDVVCRIVDLKIRPLEISGQEILTADRIGIRVNLMCTYRVVEPRTMIETIRNLENQVYACVQLVIREYIGRYRLDELLEQKEEISRFILERLREAEKNYCIEFGSAGIKDIILPGEIRDIMNTVLVAERRAQANVITRREEVASTRSLLNTAKLMDENKTLYKLMNNSGFSRYMAHMLHYSFSFRRRWIVPTILTGRYSGSPESAFDYDVKRFNTYEKPLEYLQ